jgi:hypothetical protein
MTKKLVLRFILEFIVFNIAVCILMSTVDLKTTILAIKLTEVNIVLLVMTSGFYCLNALILKKDLSDSSLFSRIFLYILLSLLFAGIWMLCSIMIVNGSGFHLILQGVQDLGASHFLFDRER